MLVNNLQVSSYVSIYEEAPRVIQKYSTIFSENQLLHWWLAPYRMVCLGVSSNLCTGQHNEEGIAWWLVFGRSLARMADEWGLWMQVGGLVLVGLLMAICVAIENLLTLFGSPHGFMVGLVLVATAKKLRVFGGSLESKKKVE